MFKKMTAQQIEKYNAKVVAQAIEWRKTMTAEQVAIAVWNKFGYCTTVRGETVEISAWKSGLIAKI